MRVLLLCNKSPYPTVEGGPIAMDAMIRGLLEVGCEVEVLAADSPKFPAGKIPDELAKHPGFGFHTAPVDLRLRPHQALWNLLARRSYHTVRFYAPAFSRALRQLLASQSFDIIQFETPFLGRYLPLVRKRSNAKVVLRAHNIEHRIWQRLAEGESNPLKKIYISDLSRLLRRFETRFARDCDGVAAITGKDAQWFEMVGARQVARIPFGMLFKNTETSPPDLNADFFHLGSMDWLPNQEGIQWFLREVWPLAIARKPDMRVFLAGRNMPETLLQRKEAGVEILGEVDDAAGFIRSHGIMVVPLRSGSGMRIKIIEGMEQGRAIVSTRIGAEGIDGQDGVHFFLADDPADFAEQMIRLAEDSALRNALGAQSREFVCRHFDRTAIAGKMLQFYNNLQSTKS